MLKKLVIKNIALIDNAEINFTDGLNVLSGETGSGKSVIIESINFVLGAKADKTLIRNGEQECMVKAEFEVSDSIKYIFDELDLEFDNLIILTRKFTIDGKSTIKINGNNVTSGMLRQITSHLVDVHGQSEHFYLLKENNQLNLIDSCGEDVLTQKNIVNTYNNEYRNIINQINELGGDEDSRKIRLDVLNYQINEIEECDFKENEDVELLEIKQKLQNKEKISLSLSAVISAINDEGGISDIISNAQKSLNQITQLNSKYSEAFDKLDNVSSEIDDLKNDLENLLDEILDEEYDADYIESRLDLIKKIKKKYGDSFEAVNDFLFKAKEEKEKLENFDQTYKVLLLKKEDLEKILFKEYKKLSNIRRKHAKNLSLNIISELKELGMEKANFDVIFNNVDESNCKYPENNGFDEIQFMFSANLGEPLKPLSSIISGGEISRFMLAIKAQTAKYNDISTFIFDEIDAGISGKIAQIVAEKFAKISLSTQVIAITHLPQISAMADNNLLISKSEINNKTLTNVKTLSQDEKIYEIIRLVGGKEDSISAKEHSIELINLANQYKKSL